MTVFQPRPTSEQGKRPGWRIGIAGTGGQGVLTAARVLCDGFAERGHEVVSSQLRGMAQRGGSVQCTVMIDCGISPVMASGAADFVLGFEPVETVRVLELMSSHTLVFMNTAPVTPYVLAQRSVLDGKEAKYPAVNRLAACVREITADVHLLDATKLAADAGSVQTLNMIMLGCLLGTGSLPCAANRFWESVTRTIPPPLVDANTRAFFSGVDLGRKCQLAEARS